MNKIRWWCCMKEWDVGGNKNIRTQVNLTNNRKDRLQLFLCGAVTNVAYEDIKTIRCCCCHGSFQIIIDCSFGECAKLIDYQVVSLLLVQGKWMKDACLYISIPPVLDEWVASLLSQQLAFCFVLLANADLAFSCSWRCSVDLATVTFCTCSIFD